MSDAIRQRPISHVGTPDGAAVAQAAPNGKSRTGLLTGLRALALPELLVGVLAFALYVPIAARVLILGPDAVEYLDVARRLAAGDGFMLGVKAFHFGGTDVLHHGLAERPPLFPVLVAGLLLLGFESVAAQVMNAALTGLCVTLVALIGRPSRCFSPVPSYLDMGLSP